MTDVVGKFVYDGGSLEVCSVSSHKEAVKESRTQIEAANRGRIG